MHVCIKTKTNQPSKKTQKVKQKEEKNPTKYRATDTSTSHKNTSTGVNSLRRIPHIYNSSSTLNQRCRKQRPALVTKNYIPCIFIDGYYSTCTCPCKTLQVT